MGRLRNIEARSLERTRGRESDGPSAHQRSCPAALCNSLCQSRKRERPVAARLFHVARASTRSIIPLGLRDERLMKLYTRQGDAGETGLFGGQRVSKCDARVACYGEVDETNAAIGLAVAGCSDARIREQLLAIQSELFIIGGELATPASSAAPTRIAPADVERLERWIDEAMDQVPPLRQFVLPGGAPMAAQLHLARTVCRRAERAVVALAAHETTSPTIVVYLNRLSDLLFALARLANVRAGVPDVPWQAPPSSPRASS